MVPIGLSIQPPSHKGVDSLIDAMAPSRFQVTVRVNSAVKLAALRPALTQSVDHGSLELVTCCSTVQPVSLRRTPSGC